MDSFSLNYHLLICELCLYQYSKIRYTLAGQQTNVYHLIIYTDVYTGIYGKYIFCLNVFI